MQSKNEKLSAKLRERWADPKYKEKMKKIMTIVRNRPEQKAITSKRQKELWADPKYKEKQMKLMEEAHASQDVRDKIAIKQKELWNTPQHKEKMAKAMEHVYKDPEYRSKRSQIAKNMWDSPEHRKLMKEQRKERALKQWEDPSHKEKMSLITKQQWEDIEYRESMTGPNNPNWKGGISCEPYCFDWNSPEFKDIIKQRDSYKCQNPGCWHKCDDKLTIHHIDYIKKNCHPINLITVCISCNSRANSKRDTWKDMYQILMKTRFKEDGITRRKEPITESS